MMLKIELTKRESTFRPGDLIEGIATWDNTATPEKLTAYLAWRTEGKGDEDSDVAIEQQWTPKDTKGEFRISWTAPRAPLSLDGTLIRIVWRVVLSSEKPDDEFALPIVISHLQTPIAFTESIKNQTSIQQA